MTQPEVAGRDKAFDSTKIMLLERMIQIEGCALP
jgi:hypothetical protein